MNKSQRDRVWHHPDHTYHLALPLATQFRVGGQAYSQKFHEKPGVTVLITRFGKFKGKDKARRKGRSLGSAQAVTLRPGG